ARNWSSDPTPLTAGARKNCAGCSPRLGSNSEKKGRGGDWSKFLRLSLGFKCDLFTLEKRVRLEERSRDLAEGNLRKEIASSLKLLDSLASLSDDNQVQEIAKKLQKSLELLNQHATRIASKAEMLGAIHQESRVSKAVEVMIQHVENLKRTYAREHAELEELKEVLLQNRRSFSSVGDRGNCPGEADRVLGRGGSEETCVAIPTQPWSSLGDAGLVRASQPNLPHRVVVVRIKWRGGDPWVPCKSINAV
uniref:Lymphoid restricted membrane protein n=1 Tax=Varanus komodoensis TaxID=61221 RepID=A0A8D2Q097_VARKO